MPRRCHISSPGNRSCHRSQLHRPGTAPMARLAAILEVELELELVLVLVLVRELVAVVSGRRLGHSLLRPLPQSRRDLAHPRLATR